MASALYAVLYLIQSKRHQQNCSHDQLSCTKKGLRGTGMVVLIDRDQGAAQQVLLQTCCVSSPLIKLSLTGTVCCRKRA